MRMPQRTRQPADQLYAAPAPPHPSVAVHRRQGEEPEAWGGVGWGGVGHMQEVEACVASSLTPANQLTNCVVAHPPCAPSLQGDGVCGFEADVADKVGPCVFAYVSCQSRCC